MTLNGVMAVSLRYITVIGNITHKAVKFVCVIKYTHLRVDTKQPVRQRFQRYLLFIYRLSFALPLLSLF